VQQHHGTPRDQCRQRSLLTDHYPRSDDQINTDPPELMMRPSRRMINCVVIPDSDEEKSPTRTNLVEDHHLILQRQQTPRQIKHEPHSHNVAPTCSLQKKRILTRTQSDIKTSSQLELEPTIAFSGLHPYQVTPCREPATYQVCDLAFLIK
ncbi:hypothetical protein QAD02_013936, partial [Eretmocerus hayati]